MIKKYLLNPGKEEAALVGNGKYGPMFGYGSGFFGSHSFDLRISPNCNFDQDSYSDFPNCFGSGSKKFELTAEEKFMVSDIEVWEAVF